MAHDFPISIMRYMSLVLLIMVSLYGIALNSRQQKVSPASATYKELPIYCVETDKPVVALTFDSAWGTEDLPEILAILKKHNAMSTFFVTGDWALKNPEAVRAIDSAGHEIANHGNTHKHMPTLSSENMVKEITGCHEKVKQITGKDMTLFRAPYSDWNEEVVDTAHLLGYMSINLSVDSLDWKDYGAESIVKTVSQHKNLENGSIILLHNGAKYTSMALDELLTSLEGQGYSFVKVSELIYTDNYIIDFTGKQSLKK